MKVTEIVKSKSYTLPTYIKVDGVLVPKKSTPLKFADGKHEGVTPSDVIEALLMYVESKGLRTKTDCLLKESLEEAYNELN